MPDAQGNYLGDRATILPDNNAAMIHIWDKLQDAEERKAQAQAQQAKEDAARRYRLGSYIGNRLSTKWLFSGTPADPTIGNIVSTATKNAYDALQKGADEVDIMDQVNEAAQKAATYSAKAKEINTNNAGQIAAISKMYPGIDPVALAEIMGHDTFYKQDEKGNWILKDPDELDANGVNALQVIKNHPDKVIKKGVGISTMIKGMPLETVGQPSVYDPTTGKRTFVGYKGKVPTEFMGYSTDEKGNTTAEVKHENYTLPDGTVYIDPSTRKPIKVASPDVYNKFMSNLGVWGDIEDDVRKDLSAINAATKAAGGKGSATLDGPMADMLRRKRLYEKLQAENQYQLVPEADKTFYNMQKIKSKQISTAHLSISQQLLKIAKMKYADGKDDPAVDIPLLTNELDQKSGENVVSQDGTALRFIDIKKIDPNDLATIQGSAKGEKDFNGNEKPLVQPATILTKDGKKITGFAVNSDGDLVGADGQIIDKQRVQLTALDEVKKDTKKDAPITIRGTIKKAVTMVKKAITPSKKIKGTDQKLY